jgi:hypothetical protein
MQNVHVVPMPKVHVFSYGPLVFAGQLLCGGKLIKLFIEISLAFNLRF